MPTTGIAWRGVSRFAVGRGCRTGGGITGPATTPTGLRASLAALCVFDGDKSLVGVAPWYVDDSLIRGRVLRPLGTGEVCSDYLSLLCHPGREAAIVQTLAEYLVENASAAAADAPCVGPCWNSTASTRKTRTSPRWPPAWPSWAARCIASRDPIAGGWICPPTGKATSRSLSSNLRRDFRRLEREFLDTGRAVLHVVERREELPRAMDIFVDLHQRRRQSLGQPGCFASSRFSGFFRDVVPELLGRGQLRLHWLELDGRPVAAECQLAGGGVLYTYQAGLEPAGDGAAAGQADLPGDPAAGGRRKAIGRSTSSAATSPTRPASAAGRGPAWSIRWCRRGRRPSGATTSGWPPAA